MNPGRVGALLLLIFCSVAGPTQVHAQSPQIRFCDWDSEDQEAVQRVWWVRYQDVDPADSNQIRYTDDIYLQESFMVDGWPSPLNNYRRIIIFYGPVPPNTPPTSKLSPEQHLIYHTNTNPNAQLGEGFPKWETEMGDYGCIPNLKTHVETGAGQLGIVDGNAPAQLENIPTRYLLSPIYSGYLPLPIRNGEYEKENYVFKSERSYRVFIGRENLMEDLKFGDAVIDKKLGADQYKILEKFYQDQMSGWQMTKFSDSQLRFSQDNKVIDVTFDIDYIEEELVIIIKGGWLTNDVANFARNQGDIDNTQCADVIDTFTVGTEHEVNIARLVEGSEYCLSETERSQWIRSKKIDVTVTGFLPAWLPRQP